MAEESTTPQGYHYIGMGLVAENKPLGTKVVLFTPYEDNPIQTDDLVSENNRLSSKYRDANGVEQTATLYTNSARPAIWLGDDSSRLTSPDVRRGEKLRLYQYADQDVIYWKEMGDGKRKRRGETIVLGASGRLDMPDSGLDDDEDAIQNSYRVEMSGHKRIINIATSAANKEVSVYNLLLDGGNGIISLNDADGNELVLDTQNKRWALRNNEGSYVVLDKKNILIGSEDGVYMQAENKIAIETKQFYLNCEEMFLNVSKQITSASPQWEHEGNVNILGDWTFTGTGKAQGGLSVTENITTDADVKTKTVSLNAHFHKAQGENSNTTAPIPVAV